jgi:hypothetical protein
VRRRKGCEPGEAEHVELALDQVDEVGAVLDVVLGSVVSCFETSEQLRSVVLVQHVYLHLSER